MPNTLAHIGIQTLLGKAVMPKAEIKWIWVACIVPDLSWILQIAVRGLFPEVSLIDLRLYAVVQSSLLFCLLIALGLAAPSRTPMKTFAILALGTVLHLLLDATQTKWGNGVLLFAPLDWSILNFELFWPEDLPSSVLTLLGAGVALTLWIRQGPEAFRLHMPSPARFAITGAAVVLWLVGPFAFTDQAEVADLHYTQTLRHVDERPGKDIMVDRNGVTHLPDGGVQLAHWTGSTMTLSGEVPPEATKISLKGTFETPDEIRVHAVQVHRDGPREWFSYAGLLLVMLWWARGLFRRT